MRRQTLLITTALIEEILTPGAQLLSKPVVCARGLPPGARLVGSYVNHRAELALVFEHDSFPEVAGGAEPPVMPPVVFMQER